MIGLSVSFCIKDILEGKVKESDVTCIIAGTRMASIDDMEWVGERYALSYWHRSSDGNYLSAADGRAILRRLWDAGKIFQARMFNGEPPDIPWRMHWLSTRTFGGNMRKFPVLCSPGTSLKERRICCLLADFSREEVQK